ncbi:hypothetical protein DFJ43DRAFT_1100704 [Lentinula guzmanii]|uniref:F-box domain-containing protein n=1 Tax=Lentinula guzmanii TaxID=2804957 RepID=A0AA38J8R4_9AGAR|nr:hypothetical protein DFJ43DRAFT_1100704 [Lentinula guzmanii]
MSKGACAAALLDRDTLSEIFRACMELLDSPENCDSNSTYTTLDTSRAPWVLGQVCHSWRHIVLSSPLLWTSVNILLDRDGSEHNAARRALFLLDLYLSRSASCPLSVSIHSSTGFQRSPFFLRSLISASSRWHTLLINIPISSYETLSVLTGFLDSLKVLHIGVPYQNKSQAIRDFTNLRDGIRVFRFCNNLERLTLNDIPFPRDVLHLPWARIHCLSVHSTLSLVTNSITIRTLHGLPNLTSCSLECRFAINCGKLHRLTLPMLRSMTLFSAEHYHDTEAVEDSGLGAAQMLSWLTLPALNQLQLRQKFKIELEHSIVVEVIQLLRRSGCEIRGLQLHLCPSISEAGVMSILKEVSPSPEKLCPLPGYRAYYNLQS